MSRTATIALTCAAANRPGDAPLRNEIEARRDARYPISRWWLRPLAVGLAQRLAATSLRPGHFTLLNLLLIACAVGVLLSLPTWPILSAGLVLAAWFCDRLDGALARAQGRQSATGAWLDGNIDELGDLALHGGMAAVASISLGNVAWGLFMGFLAGKYLLMYGLQTPEGATTDCDAPATLSARSARPASLLRALYHLPANADIRIHLAMAALVAAAWNPVWLAIELALIALYYNLRWITRYALVLFHLKFQNLDLQS